MIGIIGAMDEEIQYLLEHMEDKQEVTVAHSRFVKGELEGKEIVLLKSGIGKVNAAMGTTIMMERFSPEAVINTGSAGGFSERLEVGDLVISSEVVQHDVDVTAFDYEHGQVPGLPTFIPASDKLVELTAGAVKELNIQYEIGLIATADTFMADQSKVRETREKFPQMIAAEMEGAAIAQVCHQYDVPFVIIRALSDIAGKDSSVTFDAFLETAAKHAAQLIMKVVKAM